LREDEEHMPESEVPSANDLIRSFLLEANRVVAVEQILTASTSPFGDGDALINFDTVLLHLDDTREFWFEQLLLRWADAGRALSAETMHRTMHRFVFIPQPTDFAVLPALEHVVHANVIQLALHVQLWFGAVCHVVPVPTARLREFSAHWSSYLRDSRIMFRAPNYYLDSFNELDVMTGSALTNHRIAEMAVELRSRTVATLAYTSAHFERRRLPSAAWRHIRRFMGALYPRCLAPGCRSIDPTEVDHVFQIGPQADARDGRANSTLINLRQLCRACNRTRRKRGVDHDPYQRFFNEVLPEKYRNPELLRIISSRPPWLGGSFDQPWTDRLDTVF
jgi:hypothetical protein